MLPPIRIINHCFSDGVLVQYAGVLRILLRLVVKGWFGMYKLSLISGSCFLCQGNRGIGSLEPGPGTRTWNQDPESGPRIKTLKWPS